MRARSEGATPGPWTVRDELTIDSAEHTIARVSFDPLLMDDAGEESAANAQLIAAAPDLLEVARLAANGSHENDCEMRVGDSDDSCTCIVRPARAALAKAEGTAP